jgi:hypothetical protein
MDRIKELKWPSILMELFYVLVIAAVCFKLLYEISGVMDIRFYDETSYLERGVRFKFGYLFEDGFLYFAWYKLLSFFVKDTVTLYYLNYILLFSLIPFLMYVLLRKMGKGRFCSTFFSIALLVSNISLISWPFITRFTIVLILCTFILIYWAKSKKVKYVIALCGLGLVIYTRPEYVLSLVIFSIISIGFLVHQFLKSRRRAFALLALFTLLVTVFIVFIKNPAKAGRSVTAFGQHYAVNLYQTGKISINPNTNWRAIMKDHFGTDSSLLKAFINNPGEMGRHVFSNIRRLPRRTYQLILPYKMKNKFARKVFLITVTAVLLIAMIHLIMDIKKQTLKQFLFGDKFNDRLYYFLSMVIIIPLVINICFIYTREHYLLVLFAVLLIAMAKNVPAHPMLERPVLNKFRWVPYVMILFILYWVPWRASGQREFWPGNIKDIRHGCSNLSKLTFIKNLKVKSKIVFLGTGGSMEAYIDNFEHVFEFSKKAPFHTFVQQNGINMILVDKKLRKDTRFKDDEAFKDFITGIPDDTWTKIEIPSCRDYLAVKKEIL